MTRPAISKMASLAWPVAGLIPPAGVKDRETTNRASSETSAVTEGRILCQIAPGLFHASNNY